MSDAVRGIPRVKSARLDIAWVAAGRLDGDGEDHLGARDWSSGELRFPEAGGSVLGVGGTPWRPGEDSLVCAGPSLIDPLREALAGS